MGRNPSDRRPSIEEQLNLPPGFRFCPTDEELVVSYLSKKAASQPFSAAIIAELDLYKFDPWDLPAKALFGEKEWYFFSPRERKYPNGSRPNRAAGCGYWKATGTDKPIYSAATADGPSRKAGVKKALVFYRGKAPKGAKTNWIMHEYRLGDDASAAAAMKPAVRKKGSLRLDDWVLCRIYKRAGAASAAAASGAAAADPRGARDMHAIDEVLASLPDIGGVGGLAAEARAQYSGCSQVTAMDSLYARGRLAPPAGEEAGECVQSSQRSGTTAFDARQCSPPSESVGGGGGGGGDDAVESAYMSCDLPPALRAIALPQPEPYGFGFDDGLPSPFGQLEPFLALGDVGGFPLADHYFHRPL